MRIAVIGDSILWGQGLAPDEKIATRVARELAARSGEPVDVVSFAHSGADVWDDGETDIEILDMTPDPIPPLGGLPGPSDVVGTEPTPEDPGEREALGEAPRDEPYTLRQVERAAEALAQSPPSLVLLDAGINDVNVTNIVIPLKSPAALEARTRSIANRVHWLLRSVDRAFPGVPIVLTGYYRIVTEHTDVGALVRYAAQYIARAPAGWRAHFNVDPALPGLITAATLLESNPELLAAEVTPDAHVAAGLESFAPLGHMPRLGDLILGPFRKMLIGLSRTFADTAHEVLREQVAAFNAVPGRRAVLAVPEIPPEHAIQTNDPWLFGLDDALAPQDALVNVRRGLCDRFNVPPHTRFIWERASVGHPNARGAEAYARAVLAALAVPAAL